MRRRKKQRIKKTRGSIPDYLGFQNRVRISQSFLMRQTLIAILLFPLISFGNDSLEIGISGFVESYFVYDLNQPTTPYRQTFLVNHNRHNEFNINLGLVEVSLDHKRYHAVIGLQVGTYGQDNYASEQGLLKNIYEGYVGFSFDKESKVWLDAGVFLSHLSFESLVTPENPTMTRNLITENIPYYLSGLRLTYKFAPNWSATGYLTNGWQNIQREEGNSTYYIGTEIKYQDPKNGGFHWSTYSGRSGPDSTSKLRLYNNIDIGFVIKEKWTLLVFYDHIFQQKAKGSNELDQTISAGFVAGYYFTEKWHSAFRFEIYDDPAMIITNNTSPNPFSTLGYSLNLDYSPWEKVMIRLEGRIWSSPEEIFPKNETFVTSNFFIGTSLSVKIQ